jgi:hypothetical protein
MVRFHVSCLAGLLVAAVGALPARAGDIDKYLPDDTETVVTLNTRAFLDSAVMKKIGIDNAKEALKNVDEVGEILKDLGFDPFKDLDVIITCSPITSDQDKGLIIAHGHFDLDKFKKKAEEAAKDHADVLKIHKSGSNLIYEVKVSPEGQDVTLFVAVAAKDTLLASPGKDYVVDALKRVGDKKHAGLKNKQVQALIEKMDPKQSLSLVTTGDYFSKMDFLDANLKGLLGKSEAVTGGITVADDVKLEIGFTTKNAGDAKDLSKEINDNLNRGLGVLALLAGGQKELAPLIDFLKTIKATAKDNAVLIKGAISAEAIDSALDKKAF